MSEFQYSARLSASLSPVLTFILLLIHPHSQNLWDGTVVKGKVYYSNTIKVNIEMGILFTRLLFFKFVL